MKIIRKPIDVIAVFRRGELPMPYKVKLDIVGRTSIVKIDRITKAVRQKNTGNEEVVYVCQGTVEGKETVFELKYLIGSLTWVLYKI